MKVLFITPFNIFPPYWGGGQRTYHLLKHLAQKHEVYLVMPSYPQFKGISGKEYEHELSRLGIKIRVVRPLTRLLKRPIIEHLNPFFFARCLKLAVKHRVDAIIADYPWSGTCALPLHMLTGKPLLLLEHNIEWRVKRQVGAKFVWLMRVLEGVLCRVAERVVTVCESDRRKLAKDFGIAMKKIHVIPNGYDAERFYPRLAHKFKEKLNLLGPLIFFCGKFDYPPNKEAVYTIRWQLLHRVLAKLPRAKFVIVGGGYEFDLEHPAMLFTGPVKNIEDYLAACDIVIAPLRAGGGTRIKILEAIACGKVVVATSMAAQGLVNKLTKPAIKLATDWDAFARLVVSYLGREVEVPKRFKEYAWSSLFRRFDKLLEGL